MTDHFSSACDVFDRDRQALAETLERIRPNFDRFVEALLAVRGKVLVWEPMPFKERMVVAKEIWGQRNEGSIIYWFSQVYTAGLVLDNRGSWEERPDNPQNKFW